MLSLNPKDIPPRQLHHYLLSAVVPRPICFASTIDENGNSNLAPFSFFNVFSSNPPVAIFSPSRSGRTGKHKDTYNNIQKVREVVINMVNYSMAEQMSLASSPYSAEVDEFVKSGFNKVKSDLVQPHRLKESPVQFECKVLEIKQLGNKGGAGNLIICEILKIHISIDVLDDNQMIDQQKIDLIARMGGNWYSRTEKKSMFEITKPITTIGIGFDELPIEILNSNILTGNELGKLAGIESLPNETAVNDFKLIELSEIFLKFEDDAKKLEFSLHKKAQEFLLQNDLEAAWKTLLSFNN